MLSVSSPRMNTRESKSIFCVILFTIALFTLPGESLAQQGTLADNATFPITGAALTVRGSDAIQGAAASFVKFNLTPNLPEAIRGEFVSKATLTLFVENVSTAGSFNIYRVTSSWAQSDLSAPTYDSATPLATGVQVTAAGSYVTVDLTALVQQWLGSDGLGAGGVPNYGIALVANTTTAAFSFDSKESITTSHAAQLAIVLNHATGADTATNFSGSLAGDVAGTQNGTVVSSVGGQSAANVAQSTIDTNAATNLNAPSTIVKRDASGDFSAGTITAALAGNATTADVAKSVMRASQDADITTPANGQIYYNTTSNVFRMFDGTTSTWKTIDAGAATTLLPSAAINANQINGELTNATIAGKDVTGNIAATQINGNLTNATIPGYVALAGDTMIGRLSLPVDGLEVGTNQLVVSAGKVGIGKANPQATLDVSGDAILNGMTVGRGAGAIDSNVLVGLNSLTSNTTGANNVAVGKFVLTANTTGSENVGLGFETLRRNTTGQFGVAFGVWALRDNISGTGNSALGVATLVNNTIGSYNTAAGYTALYSNTTGSRNTAVGQNALARNTTGVKNTAVGVNSLQNNIGDDNTSMGFGALLANTSGVSNSAFGEDALTSNTSGIINSAFGLGALHLNLSGNFNSALGVNAGRVLTTGSFNTFVGAQIDNAGQKTDAQNTTAIGYGAFTTANNQVVIGNTDVVQTLLRGNVGVGTNSPGERLEVAGNLKLIGEGSGLVFPDGTIQTTSANPGDAIRNQTTPQAGANFNIGGSGTIGTNLTVSGEINGNGAGLANLDATKITAGTIDNARLAVITTDKGGTGLSAPGTAGNFLRSDGVSWNSAPLSNLDLPAGSTNYVQSNPVAQQTGVSFNIGGSGTIAGDLNVGGVVSSSRSINATTQYNQGGDRVLRAENNGDTLGGNLYVGFGAGKNTTPGGPAASDGTSNTFVGPSAGVLNTSGAANTFVGNSAGQINLTGSNNTVIGASANVAAPNLLNATAIGSSAQATKSNQVVLGDTSVTETLLRGNVGIGVDPTSKLTVAGLIESTFGGFKFPDGTTQTTAMNNAGTITGVAAGTGLTGGGTSNNVTLNVDQSVVAFQSDLATEVTNRQSAESTLQNNISSEVSNRIAADATLQNGKVARAGDTMSGTLNLPTNGLVAGSTQLVLSGGNVGIGTDTPQMKLQINGGNLYVGSAGQGIILKSPNGLVCKVMAIDNSGALVLSAITCP